MSRSAGDWRGRLILSLFLVAGVLVLISLFTYVLSRLAAGTAVGWILDELHQNLSIGVDLALPTWFATVLWALLGLIAAALGATVSNSRTSWWLLAVVAWMASVDEMLMLHERLSRAGSLVQQLLGLQLGGARWILLGVPLALFVAAALWPLVRSLPVVSRRDLVVGAALFLLGAVGFEVLQQALYSGSGPAGWGDSLANHIEEALEFAGVIIALRGLLRLLPIEFHVSVEQPGSTRPTLEKD